MDPTQECVGCSIANFVIIPGIGLMEVRWLLGALGITPISANPDIF